MFLFCPYTFKSDVFLVQRVPEVPLALRGDPVRLVADDQHVVVGPTAREDHVASDLLPVVLIEVAADDVSADRLSEFWHVLL